MSARSAHVDTFAYDNLPPRDQWPDLIYTLPELQFPDRLNCTVELVDSWVSKGHGDHPAIYGANGRPLKNSWERRLDAASERAAVQGIQADSPGGTESASQAHSLTQLSGILTYKQLQEKIDQVAYVLTHEMGLVPGNRVLLRGANNPMMAICWFAVAKAGLIIVATMPLLREKELVDIIEKAQVSAAICDKQLDAELLAAQQRSSVLKQIVYFNDPSSAGLEAKMATSTTPFPAVETAADDTVLIAFTSGSTGKPKATMHFHRDIMAICACFPRSIVGMTADDISLGTPPLAFTFGVGGLLLFPLCVGGATVLLEKLTPETLLQAVQDYHVTTTWSAPLTYRQMAALAPKFDLLTLKHCVSAGEALPPSTRKLWREATGIEIIDGIGSTEMLHIFISASESEVRSGATGKPIPGYEAAIFDAAGNQLSAGSVGRLGVKGPTGCRYLADERQRTYVQNGWNFTGDAYLLDEDGYYWFQARTDDIIVTAGYNVAGPEVESALFEHAAVAESAVVGAPDPERGTIIKAFVVLKPGYNADEAMARTLQEFVKQQIAPYKYPRAIEFCEKLPRADTGKIQRYRLRQS